VADRDGISISAAFAGQASAGARVGAGPRPWLRRVPGHVLYFVFQSKSVASAVIGSLAGSRLGLAAAADAHQFLHARGPPNDGGGFPQATSAGPTTHALSPGNRSPEPAAGPTPTRACYMQFAESHYHPALVLLACVYFRHIAVASRRMGSFASEDDGSSHYPEVGNASTAQWPGADYAGSLFSAARTSPTLSMWPLLAVAWCWLTAPVLLAPVSRLAEWTCDARASVWFLFASGPGSLKAAWSAQRLDWASQNTTPRVLDLAANAFFCLLCVACTPDWDISFYSGRAQIPLLRMDLVAIGAVFLQRFG